MTLSTYRQYRRLRSSKKKPFELHRHISFNETDKQPSNTTTQLKFRTVNNTMNEGNTFV